MAAADEPGGLLSHFEGLEDPRDEKNRRHELLDILAISVCAMICGADGWSDIEDYGKAKEDWLRSFLKLPNGIPSHDTFSRVFARLNPKSFQERFLAWVNAVFSLAGKEIVALDGKSVRRSHQRKKSLGPLHLVSAWACNARLVLGQVKTADKSNEITAIPTLLDMLNIQDAIVTIDAMGCQKDIAEKIIDGGGDYVLALKGNQEGLKEEAEKTFREVDGQSFDDVRQTRHVTQGQEHGRHEIREYWAVEDFFLSPRRTAWKNLRCYVRVKATRTENGQTTEDIRYYITSLPCRAKGIAEAIRAHWGIENRLHWVLDIGFREDESRVRIGHAAENLAILRRIALNLLKQERTCKRGIPGKRLNAGWKNDYLLKVLAAQG